ncbi:nitroreductase family deazaflavin-dependent oxidoreductase [Nocardia sp. XZ_19_385]|uniref:nitroreductase family deazaflavin-dependent oxidoreductase n=1 Tax=Nocardia sp. XZ_19_385 TaxID=2769488 RepID=UPI00189038E9|nr:nitroreductase family deazaflavin-dependent oxidoreductase [Nocardia sp. XZ_19_385]
MAIKNTVERLFVGLNALVYRVSGGKVLGKIQGAPVLLLTTVGRKTGKSRTSPLLYLRDGERYVIVGSHAGHESDPAWVYNLRAKPEAEIEIGKEKIPVAAVELLAAESAALWPRLDAMYAGYADYRTKTDRTFPVFALTRR